MSKKGGNEEIDEFNCEKWEKNNIIIIIENRKRRNSEMVVSRMIEKDVPCFVGRGSVFALGTNFGSRHVGKLATEKVIVQICFFAPKFL